MTVVKGVDKATTGLWYALYSGQAIKTATISLSKSTGGKKPEDYFTMTLSNVFVSSIHLHSGEGESGMGTESVTLSYDSIDLVYKRQGADGLLTNAGVVSFSLAAGK
jgi:type VI secretion system Hcp family effector